LPLSWRAPGNQAFLQAIKTRDDGNAEVYPAETDADFFGPLASRDNFFLSMRIKLHFHTKDCRKGHPKNTTNFTKMGTKATSGSFVALYRWAQQHRAADLANEDHGIFATAVKAARRLDIIKSFIHKGRASLPDLERKNV